MRGCPRSIKRSLCYLFGAGSALLLSTCSSLFPDYIELERKAKQYVEMHKDERVIPGRHYASLDEIVSSKGDFDWIKSSGISSKDFEQVSSQGWNTRRAVEVYIAFKLSPQNVCKDLFSDCEKPNALFILAYQDAPEAFQTQEVVEFVSEIRERYDLFFTLAGIDQEAYSSIKGATHCNLLVIAGHGIQGALTLCVPKSDENSNLFEKYTIDAKDVALPESLQGLDISARIVLLSCSTGRNGHFGDNLANCISKSAPSRTVYAPLIDFYTTKIKPQWDPPAIKFCHNDDSDITYEVKTTESGQEWSEGCEPLILSLLNDTQGLQFLNPWAGMKVAGITKNTPPNESVEKYH